MHPRPRRCARARAYSALVLFSVTLLSSGGLLLAKARAQDTEEPTVSLQAKVGAGYMRGGGQGGLLSARRAPLALDVDALVVRAPRFLLGGALRIELEEAKSVAAIVRFQLRHPFGPLELRPGIGVPFYFAPRTMLGPEASLTLKLALSRELGLLGMFSASAFVMGDDVPRGSTVIMLHVFLGLELFI